MTVLLSSISCPPKKPSYVVSNPFGSSNQLRISTVRIRNTRRSDDNGRVVKAFFFNPIDESIVKEALKEPIAFMGGMFAGLLRLDLNEDPLKEWVSRTVEASGITPEEIEAEGSKPEEEEVPQQIEIE